jgi:hypothetical protein
MGCLQLIYYGDAVEEMIHFKFGEGCRSWKEQQLSEAMRETTPRPHFCRTEEAPCLSVAQHAHEEELQLGGRIRARFWDKAFQ